MLFSSLSLPFLSEFTRPTGNAGGWNAIQTNAKRGHIWNKLNKKQMAIKSWLSFYFVQTSQKASADENEWICKVIKFYPILHWVSRSILGLTGTRVDVMHVSFPVLWYQSIVPASHPSTVYPDSPARETGDWTHVMHNPLVFGQWGLLFSHVSCQWRGTNGHQAVTTQEI